MNNYRQPGEVIDVAAPSDTLAGVPKALGSLLGVAVNDVLSGVVGAFRVKGVVELPADSADTIAVGEKVDFDISTGTIQPAAFTTATGDLIGCGTCVRAKASGETVVWVDINTPVGAVA